MSAAAAAASLKQTRMTILLSLNAVAIVIAGILIASALGLTGDGGLHVVSEYDDRVDGDIGEIALPGCEGAEGEELASCIEEVAAASGIVMAASEPVAVAQAAPNSVTSSGETTDSEGKATGGSVPNGELWNETSITIYQSADKDVCIDSSLPGYDNMYWQTSNKGVIAGFYGQARTYLGYDSKKCRYPAIVGTGTTTITAGTYDGSRRDKIEITVLPVPTEQWKHEVLQLVNNERAREGLGALSWGGGGAEAANVRVSEIMQRYEHTRPDGSSWSTALQTPSGQSSGENIAAGSSSVSPATVVAAWMASPIHRANIMNPGFRYLSVGFIFDPRSQYKTYWTQIFTSW